MVQSHTSSNANLGIELNKAQSTAFGYSRSECSIYPALARHSLSLSPAVGFPDASAKRYECKNNQDGRLGNTCITNLTVYINISLDKKFYII